MGPKSKPVVIVAGAEDDGFDEEQPEEGQDHNGFPQDQPRDHGNCERSPEKDPMIIVQDEADNAEMDEEHPNGSLKKPKTPKQRIKEGLLMSAIAEARVSDLPSAAKLRTVK